MTEIRDDYNYHRLVKDHDRRVRHGRNIFVSHSVEDADIRQMLRRALTDAQRETILLRTAKAERALYIEPMERVYATDAEPIAMRRNNLGMKYLGHDLAKAFRNFLEAVARDDNFALAHNNLGLVFLEIGDIVRAVEHFDKAVELDGTLDIAYGNRGLARLEHGDFENAYWDFQTALEIDGHDPMHHNNVGVLFLEVEMPAIACEYFSTAITLDPENPLSYKNRGLAYREMGEEERALDDFNTAIDLEEAQFDAMLVSA